MAYKQDSLQVARDDSASNIRLVDTESSQPVNVQTTVPVNTLDRQQVRTTPKTITPETENDNETVVVSVQKDSIKEKTFQPFKLFPNIKDSESSFVQLDHELPAAFTAKVSRPYTGPKPINSHYVLEKGWILSIALFSLIIFLLIKIYFPKYLSNIMTSLVNIQIAEKLMREKNVLIRRVFALLNLNFAISISLFVYLVLSRLDIAVLSGKNFLTFLIIFGVICLILVTRDIVILIIGSTFNSIYLFREYLHNNYLINKNLGLYLLPLTVSIFFLDMPLQNITFYLSIGIVSISLIYKYLRGLQILLKYNVFLFYSILYLCTLEIIPALVGLKFVLLLR